MGCWPHVTEAVQQVIPSNEQHADYFLALKLSVAARQTPVTPGKGLLGNTATVACFDDRSA